MTPSDTSVSSALTHNLIRSQFTSIERLGDRARSLAEAAALRIHEGQFDREALLTEVGALREIGLQMHQDAQALIVELRERGVG